MVVEIFVEIPHNTILDGKFYHELGLVFFNNFLDDIDSLECDSGHIQFTR